MCDDAKTTQNYINLLDNYGHICVCKNTITQCVMINFCFKYFLFKKTQLKKENKTVAEKENGDQEVYINKSGDGANIFSL